MDLACHSLAIVAPLYMGRGCHHQSPRIKICPYGSQAVTIAGLPPVNETEQSPGSMASATTQFGKCHHPSWECWLETRAGPSHVAGGLSKELLAGHTGWKQSPWMAAP